MKTVKVKFLYLLHALLIGVSDIVKFCVSANSLTYKNTNEMKSLRSGSKGFECNFSDGAHSLAPTLHEDRSILCQVSSYFIYDTVHFKVPTKNKSKKLKIQPEDCFTNVFLSLASKTSTAISTLGLIDYEIKKETKENYEDVSITLSPFNNKEVNFFCVFDNKEEENGTAKGKIGFIEIHVLKYPYPIVSVNLTGENYEYLSNSKVATDFVDKKLELTIKDGTIVVLACKEVDDKCFQRSTNNKWYKSNKIIYHKNFAIFKAPFYISDEDVTATCSCKVNNEYYELTLKPEKEKRKMLGCNFTENATDSLLPTHVDLSKAQDDVIEKCTVPLDQGKHHKLIGIHCPGKIEPNCFFQVYEYNDSNPPTSLNAVYMDSRMGISGLEYYEEMKNDKSFKVFALVGHLKKAKTFACLCKHNKKMGIMIVKLSESSKNMLSILLIVAVAIAYLII